MTVQVVLLMAGAGSRFAREGFRQSKPLIPVRGVPMFVRALEGLADLEPVSLTTVVRRQQIEEEGIDERIRQHRPDAALVVLPGMTGGAAWSARAAVDGLDPAWPVIVLDCDLGFTSPEYVRAIRAADADVVLLTFAASDARYSYAAAGPDGVVHDVAEKRVISERAIAGAYGFGTASGFLAAVDRAAADRGDDAGELYMSDVVRAALDRGAVVRAADVATYESYGTPEELTASTGVGRG